MKAREGASLEERAVGVLGDVAGAAAGALRAGRDYLASEEGRELRHRISGTLIWAAPIAGELPIIRHTLAGRVLRFAGVTALLVKSAEWLRDWSPEAGSQARTA
jgi:hypothetical protein